MRSISIAIAMLIAVAVPASAANIVELWDQAKPPPKPELQPAAVKAATTALLILDMQENSCNAERRPRCVEAVPAMADFLTKARSAAMPVVYSNTSSGSRETILSALKPQDSEPIVNASVNKFYGTELDKILKDKGVDTVIVCGTTSFGAALHTATGAAARGYNVIFPVDCVPGSSLYEEQLTVWSAINGPGTRRATTATTLGAIKIE